MAREEVGHPWLVRTLDWPFPGLGRRLEVARMRGPAGDFFRVAWPGFAGALTASAPGRSLLASTRRRCGGGPGTPGYGPRSCACAGTGRIQFIPAEHLLRDVFETCRNFGEAKHRLETTPVARPAIFTLAGARGERCVIERTEEGFATRYDATARRTTGCAA